MIFGKKDKQKIELMKEMVYFYGLIINVTAQISILEKAYDEEAAMSAFKEYIEKILSELYDVLKNNYSDINILPEDLLNTELCKNIKKIGIELKNKPENQEINNMYS